VADVRPADHTLCLLLPTEGGMNSPRALLNLQVQASRAAVSKQLAVLREAGYVDARAQLLAATLVTYNAAARTFSVITIDTRQSSVGTFEQEVAVAAVSAAWPLSTRAGVKAMVLPALAALMASVSAGRAAAALARCARKRRAQVRSCNRRRTPRCGPAARLAAAIQIRFESHRFACAAE
jgi:hypothetical protein